MLAKQLGEGFFNEKLTPICISWFNDSIYTIRESSLKIMKSLTEIFGVNWTVKHLIPKLLSLHLDPNYLHRLTPLFGIAILGEAVTADVVRKMFLPVVVSLSVDKIANIRMNCAKTIEQIHPTAKGESDIYEKFKGILKDLSNDADEDVRYYALRAKKLYP